MRSTSTTRTPGLAALAGAVVGVVGGLIGLGGAEFRLPLLVRVFGYDLKPAVFLNLAISLVTVIAALAARVSFGVLPSADAHVLDLVLALAVGSMSGAYCGATWLTGVSELTLHRTVKFVLIAIGVLLLLESVLTWERDAPSMPTAVRVLSAVLAGAGIGIVSSLLGVAGGELIIPTLVFVYGIDVKIAGTLSLLVSLPTILVGMWRHATLGNAPRGRTDMTGLVAPMAGGSIVGAVVGGLLVSLVTGRAVKALFGAVLIASALRVFRAR